MYAANHNKTDKIIILLLNSGAQTNHTDSTNRKFSDYLRENKYISQDVKKRIFKMVNEIGKMKIHLGKVIH